MPDNSDFIYDEPTGPFVDGGSVDPQLDITRMTPDELAARYGEIRNVPESGGSYLTALLSKITAPFSRDSRAAWQNAETLAQPLSVLGVPLALDSGFNIMRGVKEGNSSDFARGIGQAALTALPASPVLRAGSAGLKAIAPVALGAIGGLSMLPDQAEAKTKNNGKNDRSRTEPVGAGPTNVEPPSAQPLSSDDRLLQQLMAERNIVADSLRQEVRTGYGDRSRSAAQRLSEIDNQIAVIRRRQNAPGFMDYVKPLAFGAGVGSLAGGAFGRIAATQANKQVKQFEQVAEQIGKLANGKGNVVGTAAGDALAGNVDAAYRAGGARAPEFGKDIASLMNPTSQTATDRALALEFGGRADPATIVDGTVAAEGSGASSPFRYSKPSSEASAMRAEGEGIADAVKRARDQEFGEVAGPFDRARPFEDTPVTTTTDFLHSMAAPAGLTGTGYFESQVLAPMAERDDPSTPQTEGSLELANLIRQVGNISIGAGLGYKATNAFAKKGGFRALGKEGFATKPRPEALAKVEQGRTRLERDLGAYRNPTSDGMIRSARGRSSVSQSPRSPGSAIATPEQLQAARNSMRQLIGGAHINPKVLAALPSAVTAKGVHTAPMLQRALRTQGINVTRGQAGRMLDVLRNAGKLQE